MAVGLDVGAYENAAVGGLVAITAGAFESAELQLTVGSAVGMRSQKWVASVVGADVRVAGINVGERDCRGSYG